MILKRMGSIIAPLSLTLLLSPLLATAQGGPDCASAAAAPLTLPFDASGLTNCGSVNNYTAQNTTTCGSALYFGGQDHLYVFTPQTTGSMTIVLTSTSGWVGIFLYEGCPQGGICISSATGAGGSPNLTAVVEAGTTYYLMVDSWPAPDCHPSYTLSISEPGALPPPDTQDCFGAIPVCQGVYQEANSPEGEGNYPDEINGQNSCLGGGEVAGQWYVLTVQNSGLVAFSIIPNNMANDYDWAMYDLTNASCTDIYDNAALEVSCNFSGLAGITGANGLAGAQNNPPIAVAAGQTLALYVSNWSQSPFGYTLDFDLPNSTASIFDTSAPEMSGEVIVNCEQDQLIVQFDEFVECATVLPSSFLVTGPGGPYTVTEVLSPLCDGGGNQETTFTLVIVPPMSLPGSYELELVGDVFDLCGNTTGTGSAEFDLEAALTLEVSTVGSGCGDVATGQVIAVTSGGVAPFSFDLDGNIQVADGNFTGLEPGGYTLTVTDGNGCVLTETVTVGEATTSVALEVVVTNVSCNGSDDGTIEAIAIGDGGPWDFIWTNDLGDVVQTTDQADTDTYVGGPGTYTVIAIEGVNGSGCSDTLTATLDAPPAISISVSNDTTICLTGNAVLSAQAGGGAGGFTLQWSGGLLGNGPHTVSPSEDNSWDVHAVDMNGCASDTLGVTVTVLPPLAIIVPDTLFQCPMANVTIVPDAVDGGDGQYLYDWGMGAGVDASLTVSLSSSQEVCVTLTDGCGTPAVSACTYIMVQSTPDLVVVADTTEGCAPFSVQFALLDSSGGAQVTWDFGDGNSQSGGADLSHTYGQTGSFDVGVTVSWPNGCQSDTTLVDMIDVLSVPVADLTWSPQPVSVLSPQVQFQQLAGPGATSFDWDFYGVEGSQEPDPQHTFPGGVGDSYPVTLTVANALGCSDSITLLVNVQDAFLVFVPNAFTPNGDGVNDVFFVTGNDIDSEGFELIIFDRWGEAVFESDDRFHTWDGSYGGRPAQEGVYVWRLRARSEFNGQPSVLNGHVTLLR